MSRARQKEWSKENNQPIEDVSAFEYANIERVFEEIATLLLKNSLEQRKAGTV